MYANSSSNKRGVTILFKYTVQHEVLDMKMCPDENYLLLKVKIRNCEFLIGSIYSDTYYKDPTFLNRLKQDITSLNCENVFIAGDFNAVTSPTKISDINLVNIDAVNVNQIPNSQSIAILGEWLENSFLIDIFRQLYPERKTYSHIPFNKRDYSRTRIDFWLVSDTIPNHVKEINYLPLLSKLFDHKPVQLVFKANSKAPNFINPKLLYISGLEQIAKITTLDTHLDYIVATNENQIFLQMLRNDLTSSRLTLALLKNLLKFKNETPTDKLLEIFNSKECLHEKVA